MQSRLFENEIGRGVFQSSVQQTRSLEEYQKYEPCARPYVSGLSLLCEIFANCMLVECWTGVLQVKPRFRNA